MDHCLCLAHLRVSCSICNSDQASLFSKSSISTNATADNLPGPGRTLGLAYGFAGRRLEAKLSSIAEGLGLGPRAVAHRIQKRRANFAFVNDSSALPLTTVKAQNEKIEKDCRRLLKYVGSNVASTRMQALDHITEFSVNDQYVRGLLKVLGAVEAIDPFRKHHTPWMDLDSDLLASSRKALVSLADVEVNVLAKKIDALVGYKYSRWEVGQWFDNLVQYLNDPDRSFLVLRHIERFARKVVLEPNVDINKHIKNLVFVIDCFPDILEWESLDRLVEQLFHELKSEIGYSYTYCENWSILLERIIQHADKLPRTMHSDAFRWFMDFDRTEDLEDYSHAFFTYLLLRSIASASGTENVMFLTDLEHLRALYPHLVLLPLVNRLVCKPDLVLCQVLNERKRSLGEVSYSLHTASVISPEMLQELCQNLASYVDSEDSLTRERSIYSVKVMLAIDIYCRTAMLRALRQTQFASASEYTSIVEDTESVCKPQEWPPTLARDEIQVYRHCDAGGNFLHLCDRPFECEEVNRGGTMQWTHLAIDREDVLELHIPRGEAVSCPGHHLLVAGRTVTGECKYVAYVSGTYSTTHVAVSEGTRPEDVCFHDEFCVDGPEIKMADHLTVYVLRYARSAYARVARYAKHMNGTKERQDPTAGFFWRADWDSYVVGSEGDEQKQAGNLSDILNVIDLKMIEYS